MVTELVGVKPEGLYSIGQACTILGIHRNTLRNYTASGKLKSHIHTLTGKQVYRGSDIVRFFNSVI